MKNEKEYFKKLDIIRIISCIAVLLYHFDILKGGYLAVCTFFVLSSYLSCMSLFRKEKISIIKYYKDRLIHIYLPLIFVVFISIFLVDLLKDFVWISLKPETNSVIFGYNNFWQLSANLDYFARHINSPFMHFWYIGILLQFELVFPFIFLFFKKLGDKINKIVPIILLTLLTLISTGFFMYSSYSMEIMEVYYNTFTRSFSLIYGILIGFIHFYYHDSIKKIFKENIFSKIMFYVYLIFVIAMFIFIDSNSCFFNIAMILSTIISCCLIDYSIRNNSNKQNNFDKIIKYFSKISYEIYLVQYPVIFLFQDITMNIILKTIIMILIILIVSILLHFILDYKNVKGKTKLLKIFLLILVSIPTILGLYHYVITEDHTEEMKKLEEDLAKNSALIEEQQQQYLANLKNEEDEWEKALNDLDASEKDLKEKVRKMRIVGVGDSVMELAVRDLYNEFPNGYFDARTNRTEHEVNRILQDLKDKNALGDAIVLNIGTNGGWNKSIHDEMLRIVGDRKIFWLNATNPDYPSFNGNLIEFANSHSNVYIIDWISVAKAHPEYLIYDRVHPTVKGCKVYASTIYEGIYQIYLQEFNKKKEEKLKEHEEELKTKISFYGNDLLLNDYEYLKDDFENAKFIIDKEYTYTKFKNQIINESKENKLTYKLVFVFDSSMEITNDNYKELIELLPDHEIYIVSLNNSVKLDNEEIKIIEFNNDNYLMVDGVHLTKEGNIALSKIISNMLNNKEGE